MLGRLLLALQRETDLGDLLGSLDFWAALGAGAGYVLEWWSGPHVDELHTALMAQLAESGTWVLTPQDFQQRTDVKHSDPAQRLFLLIRGVPVEFRSCAAIGLQQALAIRTARIRRVVEGRAGQDRPLRF